MQILPLNSICLWSFMMLLRLLCLLFFCAASLWAQDRSTNRWYFYNRLGLDFNTSPPTVLTDGRVANTLHREGTSVISDAVTGALLFYSDGDTVWNRNHQIMVAGIHPESHSSTQSALIIRQPNSTTLYHLFTTAGLGKVPGARHLVIDITMNGGLGGVASNTQLIANPICEKVTAARACDGVDYWVIFRRYDAPEFRAFRLSPTGLNTTPVISNSGIAFANTADARGEMKISPNGRLLACANETNITDLFDFNNATGQITNRRILSPNGQRYGLTFSPNSNWLYVNDGWVSGSSRVFRYDMTAANIAASQQVIATSAITQLGYMELAPDGRIYISHHASRFLSTISNPDAVNPVYTDQAIDMGALMGWGLPNFPQDLFIPDFAGRDTLLCPDQPVRIGIPALSGYTYRWSPVTGLDNPNQAQPTATASQTTTYTVTVTDPNGCSIVRDMTLSVRPRPTIALSSNKANNAICPDDNIQLTATMSGAVSVNWQPGNLSGAVVTVTPTSSTTYRASLIDANACIWVDSIAVTVRPRPTLTIQSSRPAQNDTVRMCTGLNATLAATAGLSSYQWSGGETAANITVTAAGRYIVEGTDANGCKNNDTIYVELLPLPVADAGRDTSVCAGNTLQLQASGGTSYNWIPLAGSPALSQNNVANPQLSSQVSGDFNYAVQVTGSNGCVNFDTLRVRVHALPVAVISPAAADTSICICSSITLSANPAVRYEWYRNTPNQIVGTTQSLVVRDSGSYTVRIIDTNGCEDIADPVNVHILPQSFALRVRVPDSALVGAQVNIGLSGNYTNLTTLASCPSDSFTLHISMNRHPFGAKRGTPSFGTVTGDIRTLNISGATSGQGSYALQLPYTVTLGAADSSIIRIDSVSWKSCILPVTIINDTFHVAGICTARGTKRLYNEGATVTMMVQPNPVSEQSGVVLDASAAIAGCRVFLSDILGRTVATIYEGDIAAGRNEFSLPARHLPEGVYSLVFRSPAHEVLNVMVEVRK